MTIDELKVIIRAELGQFKKDVADAKSELKGVGKEAKESSKETSSFGKEFNSFLRKIAAAKILFDLILKAIKAIVQCIKDGVTSLSNFDSSFKQEFDTMKASFAQLKDAIGAAFAPIIKVALPAIIKITQMTTELFNTIGQAFSKVTGSAWVKASDDVDKYKKSVENAKKATLGIDEINTLNADGGQSNFELGAEGTGLDNGFSAMVDSITESLAPVFDILKSVVSIVAEIVAALNPIVQMTNKLLTTILQPLSKLISNLLQKMLPAIQAAIKLIGSILEPIFALVGEIISAILDNIPAEFFEALSDVLSEIFTIIGQILQPVWKIVEILSPILSGVLGAVIRDIANALTIVLNILKPVLNLIEIVLSVVNGIFETIVAIFSADFDSLGDIWAGVGEEISGIWNRLIDGMKDLWNSFCNYFRNLFKTALNGIIWLLNGLIDGVNLIIAPLRGIIWGIAAISGSSATFDDIAIPHIPTLAKGGVIDSPTIAMMGEYSNARSNPEIAAPESTLKAIVNEGNEDLIATFIQVGRQLMSTIEEKNLSVSIGDDVIAASAARGNRSYFNRTGSNLITV